MASLVSIYLIILVLNITIVNFIVYRINIVFNTYIFLCINVNYKLDSLISNIYIILLEVLMKKMSNLYKNIIYIYEAVFFMVYGIYTMFDVSQLHSAIKIGSSISIILVLIYTYKMLEKEKKDANMTVMFLSLNFMMTVGLGIH